MIKLNPFTPSNAATPISKSIGDPVPIVSFPLLMKKLNQIQKTINENHKNENHKEVLKEIKELEDKIKKPLKITINARINEIKTKVNEFLSTLKADVFTKTFEDIYELCMIRAFKGKKYAKDFDKFNHQETHDKHVDYYEEDK